MKLLKAYLSSYSRLDAVAVGDACFSDSGSPGHIVMLATFGGHEPNVITPSALDELAALVIEFEDHFVTVDYKALEEDMSPIQ